MANGKINVRHNFTGNPNFIIMQLVKATAPLAEVQRVVYPSPHVEESYLFDGLSPVWYLIKFWQSSNGSSLDTVLLTLAGNAKTGGVYPVVSYDYVVDRGASGTDPDWSDPVQDDTSLRDERLSGAVQLWVEERGTGRLLPDAEYIVFPGGGWDWPGGKVFNTGGIYFATAVLSQSQGDGGGSGVDDIEGIFPLTANQPFDPNTMNGKDLIAAFSGTQGVLTFGALAGIPDCRFKIATFTGTQRNLTLQLAGGDTVNYYYGAMNKIILGKNESMELAILNGVMYVIDAKTGYERLGEEHFRRSISPMVNTMLADGNAGVALDESEYPRVSQYLDTITTVSLASWASQKGMWARGSGTFIPPSLNDGRFLKGVALSPGVLEASSNKSHTHRVGTSGGPGNDPGRSIKRSNAVSDGYELGNGISPYIETEGETEAKPKNVSLIPHICI